MTAAPRQLTRVVTLVTVPAAGLIGLLLATAGTSNAWIAAALGVAILPVLFIADREYLVFGCMVAAYLLDWAALDIQVLPPQAPWLLEVSLAVLLLRSVGTAYRQTGARIPLTLVVMLLVVVASAAFALSAGLSPVVALIGLRKYLRFPLIAVAMIIAPMREGFERRLWVGIALAAAVQIPVSLIQLATRGGGDVAPGTFGPGGTGIEALFLTLVAATIALRAVIRTGRVRGLDIVLALVVMLPTIVGSAVIVFIAFPVCLLFGLLAFGLRPGRMAVSAMVLGLVLLAVTPYALDYTTSIGLVEPRGLLSSPAAILAYDRKASAVGVPGRIYQVAYAGSITLSTDPATAVFGHGPGSASPSSLGAQYDGPLLRLGSVRQLVVSSVVALVETGLAGVAAVAVFLVMAIRMSIATVRATEDGPLRVIAVFTGLCAMLMLWTTTYSDPWFTPGVAVAFWIGFGVLASRAQPKSDI
jgi:hypothetical protein